MIIKIDTNKYPLEAILATSYKFIDRYYISHRYSNDSDVEISFMTKKEIELHDLESEYLDELESVSMYIEMDKKNNKYRKYIVGQSLFSLANDQYESEETAPGDNQAPENNEEGLQDDPLEIAVPWEEKYGDKVE